VGDPGIYPGESAYCLCANRNKRSITLNMKAEEGRAILKKLAAIADVVVENFFGKGNEP
jgi:crotonobetainyl-CoA:carnitine CoA-transferase CaiB-like acyl-CoA transferase